MCQVWCWPSVCSWGRGSARGARFGGLQRGAELRRCLECAARGWQTLEPWGGGMSAWQHALQRACAPAVADLWRTSSDLGGGLIGLAALRRGAAALSRAARVLCRRGLGGGGQQPALQHLGKALGGELAIGAQHAQRQRSAQAAAGSAGAELVRRTSLNLLSKVRKRCSCRRDGSPQLAEASLGPPTTGGCSSVPTRQPPLHTPHHATPPLVPTGTAA